MHQILRWSDITFNPSSQLLKQGDCKFEAKLSYIVRPCLKTEGELEEKRKRGREGGKEGQREEEKGKRRKGG